MRKKIVALLLAVLVCLCVFSACKSDKKGAQTENGTTAAAQTDASADAAQAEQKSGGKSDTADASGSAESGKSGENATASADNAQTTAKTAADKTGGWEKQQNGELEKGDVRVNVAKYDSTSIAEGEQLIQQLIKGGLSSAKVLSSEKTKTTVIYTVSGKRIGGGEKEFVKFQFLPKNGTGYLVTVMAKSQADLDTDISYVLTNVSELAQ